MIVRMGLLKKRPELTLQEFDEYWAREHAGLARTLPGLRAYHQNHVTEAVRRGIDFHRESKDYDGFSQLWFDDMASMVRAMESQSADLAADERAFIADLDLVVAEPVTVVPPAPNGPAVKRMSTLRRRPDRSAQEFVQEWRTHGELVKRMPGLAGYIQNIVVARATGGEAGKSGTPSASYDDVPVDGVVEMWFHDVRDIEGAFSSPEGQATMQHATTFLADINTYLVDCVRIL